MLEKLQEIANEIKNLTLATDHKDGRINSSLSEENVMDKIEEIALLKNYKVIRPEKERHWYDIALEIENVFLPINVKITEGGTDNISSKKGMLYALTGINSDIQKVSEQWNPFHTTLFDNINPNLRTDYYFIVVFKSTEEVVATSLFEIDLLTPNGNNLPFQCNWGKLSKTKRTRNEQFDYIIQTYYNSWRKKEEKFTFLQEKMEEKWKI